MHSADFAKLREENRRLRAEAERLCEEVRQKIEHLAWVVESIRREWEPAFFQPLQRAIRTMYGYESRHLASFAVRKVRGQEVLWLGIVEEFALIGTDGAASCYGWQYAENGQPRTFTLLKQKPIDTPQAAVQIYLLAKEATPDLLVRA